jgi:hypothetical protein
MALSARQRALLPAATTTTSGAAAVCVVDRSTPDS